MNSEKLSVTWNDFQSNISSTFQQLREDNEFSDVTLVCEDNQRIECHKIVLSSASSFFKSLLVENLHSHPMIYMRKIKSRSMGCLLDFIYNGEANVHKEDLNDFLEIAKELGVRGVLEGSDQEESNVARENTEYFDVVPDDNIENVSPPEEITTKKEAMSNLENTVENIKDNDTNLEFKCDICGNVFVSPSRLKKHKETLHKNYDLTKIKANEELKKQTNTNLKCKICGLTQASAEKLSTHEGHHKKFTFPCPDCKRSFKYESSLEAHITIVHVAGSTEKDVFKMLKN